MTLTPDLPHAKKRWESYQKWKAYQVVAIGIYTDSLRLSLRELITLEMLLPSSSNTNTWNEQTLGERKG